MIILFVGNGTSDSSNKLNVSHLEPLLSQLSEHAAKWRDFGTYLGFRPGELSKIESKPLLLTDAPQSWLRALLEQWLEWTPGDERRSTQYPTLKALKTAVDKAGLGRTASELTLQKK